MEVIQILFFIVLGCLAGSLAGLLGIGGGIIIVPGILGTLMLFQGHIDKVMEYAVATSLACITVAAAISSWLHHRKEAVVWSMVRMVSLGILLGVILGVSIAHYLPNEILIKFFGVFALGMGIYFLVQKKDTEMKTSYNLSQYRFYFGILIGFISNILGIGGGVIGFPLYLHCGLGVTRAVGTSSFTTFITALLGTILYALIGLHSSDLSLSIGYIYLPAFASIVFGMVLLTPVGVRYAHKLPSFYLKKIFGGVLICIAAWMLFY